MISAEPEIEKATAQQRQIFVSAVSLKAPVVKLKFLIEACKFLIVREGQLSLTIN
jgi:hypothetical protein